ncbi:MAG: B12-binding domain-containing radical SAM protein [Vicinamibacterales bacterium]
MKVGILEILGLPARYPADLAYHLVLTKQNASVTPQAVSVWCRHLGHETFYAPYYGLGDPGRQLPSDLDIVFIASYTQDSALAYALAKKYRRAGVRTVIGGPHAKAFPADCLRFFDLVVKECDKSLITDILAGHFDPGSIISSAKPLEDLPTVQERMPEIRKSAFLWSKRRYFMTTVPMLASVGCPYNCNFCIDWDNPYRLLPLDRLAADLRFVSTDLRGVLVAFHDPNFGVKFDQVLEVLDTIPPDRRNPYVMESSLSILRGSRVNRLKETNCVAVAPGVESWTDYSNKAGAGLETGMEKLDRVAEHFRHLHENVPYLQANFIFGLDTDEGNEPLELTKEFMTRTPFVWPALNIPVPYGGTPLYEQLREEGRILKSMPFSFCYAPYLRTTLKNYDSITYYEKLIELLDHSCSRQMLDQRMKSTTRKAIKIIHWTRTVSTRACLDAYRNILHMLRTDRAFRTFHEGRTQVLPEFYHRMYEQTLGNYAELMTRRDRIPNLEQAVLATAGTPTVDSSHKLEVFLEPPQPVRHAL